MMLATSTEHRKLPFVGTRELSASMVPVGQVLAKQIATALDRSVQQREKCGSLLVSQVDQHNQKPIVRPDRQRVAQEPITILHRPPRLPRVGAVIVVSCCPAQEAEFDESPEGDTKANHHED
jgi:hypothetical protein